ncbi:hypothetical protein BDZ89DRAFT_1106146 [Hymenopellis radicata]|nr:hypothetical protein BDZ89DRAFT_1106146 [Hymenopellis radicata]
MKIVQLRTPRQPRLAIDISTSATYDSHLNSYLNFCTLHHFPVEPTPDTLSFYVVYMCANIKPRSVASYLTGICNKLEPYFPGVSANRKSILVARSLSGCMKRYGTPIQRKLPLARQHILSTINDLPPNASHDSLLFAAMLTTGFMALLRLGEMSLPDNVAICDLRKCSRRSTVTWFDDGYGFDLPYHKADRFFEATRYGSSISRLNPFLWVTAKNEIPTRTWFMKRLRRLEPDEQFAGQSMRAGGATAMAEDGCAPTSFRLRDAGLQTPSRFISGRTPFSYRHYSSTEPNND